LPRGNPPFRESFLAAIRLFASGFLASTLPPGGSELVLYTFLRSPGADVWAALAVATFGGMASYLVGRLIPQHKSLTGIAALRRHGAPALLLSWVPIIGDALCVGAGWLRMNVWLAGSFMALGKFGRYAAIAAFVA
jgi:membrane protein YqaA with SNARE-associated domain